MRFDVGLGIARLTLSRISQASATQRAGRAGRVRAGTCYHLFTQHEWPGMEPQQTPEIQRAPLAALCLRVALMQRERAEGARSQTIRSALDRLPAPPALRAVNHALRALTGLGALSAEEALTPLGAVMAALPTEPRVGKLLVLGCVFKCLEPALLVAAALSQRSPFTAPSDWDERDRAHAARAAFDSMSDHIAALRAYRTWESLGGGGGGAARWARANYVSIPDLKGMRDTARQYRTHLARLGVASLYDARRAADGAFDVRSDNAALLKAMLVAAFYPCVALSFFFPRFLLFAHLFCLSFQVRRDDWRPGKAARRQRRGGAAQRRGGARLSHARRLR